MTTEGSDAASLSGEECQILLRSCGTGRLVVLSHGEPQVFPVSYAMDGDDIVFRTAAGTKLDALSLAASVVFEVDGTDPGDQSAWSVVVRGRPDEVLRADDQARLEQLDLRVWDAGAKDTWVVLHPAVVTGRRVGSPGG